MKILVTGLNGIIGWNLFLEARRSHETLGTFRKNHPGLPPEAVQLDMLSGEAVSRFLESVRPDIILHSWAMCDLDLCEQFPAMAEEVNVAGAAVWIQAARRLPDLKKFVYLSTDHVFDGEEGGYTEDMRPRPKHTYGRTKLAAEDQVRESGLPWQILRPGLVIGASLQGVKGPRDFLFHRTRAGKPTHYFTDEWRSPIEAPIFARQALELALSEEQGVFHIAGPRVFSRYDLALHLAGLHGLPTRWILPRLRREDRWASMRPRDLSLRSLRLTPAEFAYQADSIS